MAYATIMHVEAMNTVRGPYTASTKPTATQVAMYLDEISGEIDGVLRTHGYAPPAPSSMPTGVASSVLVNLQRVNALGAVAMVEEAAQASDRRDQARLAYESALTMLGEIDLDIGSLTDKLPKSSFTNDTPSQIFSLEMLL